MTTRRLIGSTLLTAVLASGCAATTEHDTVSPAAPPAAPVVTGKAFRSTEVVDSGKPKQLAGKQPIRIAFRGDKIAVQAGCNGMGGQVTTTGGKLVAKDLAGTLIACDPPLMAQDTWVRSFLTASPTWKLDGKTLVLTTASARITLTEDAAAKPVTSLPGTSWTATSLVAGTTAGSLPAGTSADLTFGPGSTVSGHTGCNAFTGTATLTGNSVTFSKLKITRKGCDGAKADLEKQVVAALDGKTVTWSSGDGTLTLTTPDGQGLQFTKK